MITDSIVVYRSFIKAIKKIKNPLERLSAYEAMFDYGFEHIDTELEDGAGIALELIKPQLDANFIRKMDGKKGGRPMKSTETQSNKELEDKVQQEEKNHRLLKTKTTGYENEKPNVNVNANVNANGKEEIDKEEIADCSPEFKQALKDFEDMRKKIKHPLTPRAKQMILNKLSRLAPDEETQTKILNQSVLHSWQDVYEIKEGQRSGRTNAFEELMKA